MFFHHLYKGKQLLWSPVCVDGQNMDSTFIGKNLLLLFKHIPLSVLPGTLLTDKNENKIASTVYTFTF